MLDLLRRWGADQSRGMGVEFRDANGQLPMPYRNTIANMMAEAEAQNGIFSQDGITTASKSVKGIRSAWVKDQQVMVENGRVTTYRVNLKVTFVLQD